MLSHAADAANLASRRRRQRAKIVDRVVWSLLCGGLLIVFVFPFVYMVVLSLKNPAAIAADPHSFIFTPTLSNYTAIIRDTPFLHQLRNSAIVGFGSVLFSFLIGLPAAYVIGRQKMKRVAITVLIVRMVPSIVFILPIFIVYGLVGLRNTHIGLIISHLILVLPLMIWLMIGFFEDVPRELEEQAYIDGCTHWGAFLRIAIPLVSPGLVVTGILALIQSWNDLIFVLVLSGNETQTLPMAVFQFMDTEQLNLGGIAAAAALLTVPVMIMGVFAQRWLAQGLTLGGVK